jgi:hypothetical protein
VAKIHEFNGTVKDGEICKTVTAQTVTVKDLDNNCSDSNCSGLRQWQ